MELIETGCAISGVASMYLLSHKFKAGLWVYVISQGPWIYICFTKALFAMAVLAVINSAISMHGLWMWEKKHG